MLITALVSVCIVIGLELFSHIINYTIKCVINVLSIIFGSHITTFILNYVTFIGVIHHELSHMIFAFITGAKIVSFKLFKVFNHKDSLGTVKINPRGPYIIRGLQLGLSAIAPLITGIINVSLVVWYILSNNLSIVYIVALIYCIVSIVLHMTLSNADIDSYRKGRISIGLIIWIILFLGYKVEIVYNILR